MTSAPQYFYTDPLAAAWMSKHFGMRFTDRTEREETEYFSITSNVHTPPPADIAALYPLYIHPDSLELLEPLVGDFVVVSYGHSGIVRSISDAGDNRPFYHINTGDTGSAFGICGEFLSYEGGCKVIQRDDKAFHWPEFEAA